VPPCALRRAAEQASRRAAAVSQRSRRCLVRGNLQMDAMSTGRENGTSRKHVQLGATVDVATDEVNALGFRGRFLPSGRAATQDTRSYGHGIRSPSRPAGRSSKGLLAVAQGKRQRRPGFGGRHVPLNAERVVQRARKAYFRRPLGEYGLRPNDGSSRPASAVHCGRLLPGVLPLATVKDGLRPKALDLRPR